MLVFVRWLFNFYPNQVCKRKVKDVIDQQLLKDNYYVTLKLEDGRGKNMLWEQITTTLVMGGKNICEQIAKTPMMLILNLKMGENKLCEQITVLASFVLVDNMQAHQ